MTDDDLKSLLLAHSSEIRRHFDVSLERMDARFALLAESMRHVDDKLDRTREALDEKIERTARDAEQ